MKRRNFIALLVSTAAAWPLAARAQQSDPVREIGVLMTGRMDAQLKMDAIQQGLQKLGWSDGHNIRIEYRWAVGDAEQVRAFAKELVDHRPDIVVVQGSIAVQAVLQETETIPIVFVQVIDPVGQGFTASMARPGGNVTGFSIFEDSMGGKWLALLKEIAPDIARVAVVANPGTTPYGIVLRSVQAAAPRLGVELISALVHDTTELEMAITAQGREPGGALLVLPDVFTSTHRELIIQLTARHRLPAIYSFRFFVTSGGLISYGVDPDEPFRQVPIYVNRILRGERPGDLPVQAPTKFELVVNLKTARTLGLTVPPTLLATADEVIE
jgi:putative tryptophan/tyrosine transport system substrate-binding protein